MRDRSGVLIADASTNAHPTARTKSVTESRGEGMSVPRPVVPGWQREQVVAAAEEVVEDHRHEHHEQQREPEHDEGLQRTAQPAQVEHPALELVPDELAHRAEPERADEADRRRDGRA